MKRIILISSLALLGFLQVQAQEVGLSFSYFIPRNGYFSTPISPFSIRGLGVNLNRYIAIETGASLYRMSGLNIVGLPFESKEALLGPNFTVFVPVELVIQFQGKQVEFDIKGGGFAFYGFDQKLNYGNIDRSIQTYQSWDVANADLKYSNNPGFGFLLGAELTFDVTRQFGISFETNYLMGSAKFPLTGSYTGGTMTNPLETIPVDFKDAKVDFTGLEFSIGVIFSGR
jgi:opacity protein-like surface antigen